MPKKSKREAGVGKRSGGAASNKVDLSGGSDDEDSLYNDAGSVSSMGISEVSTAVEEEDMGSPSEIYESKIKDAIDLATEKAAATRIKGIDYICTGLLKRYCPDFIEGRKATITDVIEKGLKKGKGGEVTASAKLALLLGVQLIDAIEVYQELHGPMLHMVTDKTQSSATRGAVGQSVSGLCFIAGGDLAEVVRVMKILESVFVASLPKQDGTSVKITGDQSGMHAACLSGWSLLSTLLTPAQIFDNITSYTRILRGLLSSTDVDLRITAGEAIALVLEAAYEYDEDYVPDNFNDLLAELKQLATDSSKSKSKKDRKEQRSSFRDVLRAVEEGEQPSETVKFGKEVLKIDSWYSKCQYDWFCKIMGTGINTHMSTNLMLRQIFQLGPTINMLEVDGNKLTKTQRNAANQQAFKMRTQQRSKHRDKRTAVF